MTDYDRLTYISAQPGLLPNEYTVLTALANAKGNVSRTDLMGMTSLSDSSIRNALRTLTRRGLVAVSESGQTKLYAWPDEINTLLTGSDPAPAVPDDISTMTLAQIQDAVIDAWAKGAGVFRPTKDARGPLYDAAASLGRAIQRGTYELADITRCTREKVRDPYNRKRPHTWTLSAIARELHGWKALQQRKKTHIDPPPGFKSGTDPKTGLCHVWNHQTGTEEVVEMATPPTILHQDQPDPLAGRRDPGGEARFHKDWGRETYSLHHYMDDDELTLDDLFREER